MEVRLVWSRRGTVGDDARWPRAGQPGIGFPARENDGRVRLVRSGTDVRIGTSGYVYASWKRRFYPVGLPARSWLSYYATHFNTVELKLASGTSAPHRLRDLADVQEIIKARGLDDAFGEQLDASVRQTYLELLRAVRAASPEPT